MDVTRLVFVGVHEHHHGTDVRVFNTEKGAWNWGLAIAKEFWPRNMDVPMPETDEEIFDMYWDWSGHCCPSHACYFNIYDREIQE